MMKWSLVRLAIAALLLADTAIVSPAGAAPLAGDQWCEDDPPVVIVTPGGHAVLVYVTDGALGVQHLAAVQAAQISYTTAPTGDGGTLVHMAVQIADDAFGRHFPTRGAVSSGPFTTGTVYARAGSVSGEPLRMAFKLDVG